MKSLSKKVGFALSCIERKFSNIELYGSEVFSKALDFAKRRITKATLFQMDARAIPFKGEFDVIDAFDVIEHILDDKIALGQIYKALKSGGGIILTVPQHKSLWSKVKV